MNHPKRSKKSDQVPEGPYRENVSLFMNYRREDSADLAGRLYEHVVSKFGPQSIFKDVNSLAPGDRFDQKIMAAIDAAETVLVLIGPRWLVNQRLDHANDYVRREIEYAIEKQKTIVPVLLGDTKIPQKFELPSSLWPLLEYNAVRVRPDPDFKADVERLIHGVSPPDTEPTPLEMAVEHQIAALPLHLLIVSVFGVLALASIVGGLYAINSNASSPTKLALFGTDLSTGSVGVAFVFIGLTITLLTVRGVLRNQKELASLPSHTGNTDFGTYRLAYRFLSLVLVFCVVMSGLGTWIYLGSASFDTRIRFVSVQSHSPQPLIGTVKLLLGADEREAKLNGASDVLFQGIGNRWKNTSLRLSLDVPPYRLLEAGKNGRLDHDTIDVEVYQDDKLKLSYAGTLSTPHPMRPIYNATIALIGTHCTALTNSTGYFDFKECTEAERLINASVLVTLPRKTAPCPDPLNLQPLPRLSDLTMELDCAHLRSGPAAPLPPKEEIVRDDKNDEYVIRPKQQGCDGLRNVLITYFGKYASQTRAEGLTCLRPCHVSVDDGKLLYSFSGGPSSWRVLPHVRLESRISCSDRAF